MQQLHSLKLYLVQGLAVAAWTPSDSPVSSRPALGSRSAPAGPVLVASMMLQVVQGINPGSLRLSGMGSDGLAISPAPRLHSLCWVKILYSPFPNIQAKCHHFTAGEIQRHFVHTVLGVAVCTSGGHRTAGKLSFLGAQECSLSGLYLS